MVQDEAGKVVGWTPQSLAHIKDLHLTLRVMKGLNWTFKWEGGWGRDTIKSTLFNITKAGVKNQPESGQKRSRKTS